MRIRNIGLSAVACLVALIATAFPALAQPFPPHLYTGQTAGSTPPFPWSPDIYVDVDPYAYYGGGQQGGGQQGGGYGGGAGVAAPYEPKRYALLWGKNPWVDDMSRWLTALGWIVDPHANEFFQPAWIQTLPVRSQDHFLFYFAGSHATYGGNHGEAKVGSFYPAWWWFGWKDPIPYSADEGLTLQVGNDLQSLYDDELTDLFKDPKWNDVYKMFILDTCLSGGFWGGEDLDGSGDLERLKNASLIASSKEDELTYALPSYPYGDDQTYLTHVILKEGLGQALADTNKDGDVSYSELRTWVDGYGPMLFNEAHIYGLDYDSLYTGYQQPRFYTNITPRELSSITFGTHPVPEPATVILLAGGIAVIVMWERRRRTRERETGRTPRPC